MNVRHRQQGICMIMRFPKCRLHAETASASIVHERQPPGHEPAKSLANKDLTAVLDAAVAVCKDILSEELHEACRRDVLWLTATAGINEPIPNELVRYWYWDKQMTHPFIEKIKARLAAAEPALLLRRCCLPWKPIS